MAADLVDHIVTGISTIVVGVVGWVWRLGNRLDNHHTRLGIYEANDTKQDTKLEQHDGQLIRHDTMLTQSMEEFDGINRKPDNVIDQLADAKVTRAIVKQMQRQLQRHA
jgi:hypothetical protein